MVEEAGLISRHTIDKRGCVIAPKGEGQMIQKAMLAKIAVASLLGVLFLSQRVLAQGLQPAHTTRPVALEGTVCRAEAESYLKAGRLDLAGRACAAIATARSVDTLTPVPTASPLPTGTASATPNVTAIARLAQIGAPEDAWTEYKTAIKNNPGNEDLLRLARAPWVQWQKARAGLTTYGEPILALVCVALFLSLFGYWVFQKRRSHLDIDCFRYGTMKFDEKTSDPNQALITAFEKSMRKFYLAEGLKRPDMIDQPMATFDLPAPTPGPAQMGELLNFINKLIPAKVISLKGSLERDKQKGAGLTIRIFSDNKLIDCYDVWQYPAGCVSQQKAKRAKPALADYLQLAEEASIRAIWVICKDRKRNNYRRILQNAFGTGNVDSYLAIASESRAMDLDALKCALACDPKNHVANLNLAHVLLQEKDQETPEPILRVVRDFSKTLKPHQNNLETAKLILEKTCKLSKPLNPHPTYIAANYLWGLALVEEYLKQNIPGDKRNLKEEKQGLKEAKEHLARAWKVARLAHCKKRKIVDINYLRMIKILYMDVIWWPSKKKKDPLGKDIRAVWRAYDSPKVADPEERVLYNLASHYSMAAKYGKPDPKGGLQEALKCLEIVLQKDPSYAKAARDDPALETLRNDERIAFYKLIDDYDPKPKN
jgi:hypothetical protein